MVEVFWIHFDWQQQWPVLVRTRDHLSFNSTAVSNDFNDNDSRGRDFRYLAGKKASGSASIEEQSDNIRITFRN